VITAVGGVIILGLLLTVYSFNLLIQGLPLYQTELIF
jgi:hypothetical protein